VAAVGFELPTEMLRDGDSMAMLAIEDRSSVVSYDLRTESRFPPPTYLLDAGVAGAACAPIHTGAGEEAVICAYSAAAGAFGEADVTFLRFVAQLISTAVQGQRLRAELSARGPDAGALLDAATLTILGAAEPAPATTATGAAARRSRTAADRAPRGWDGLSVGADSEAAQAFGNILQVIGGYTKVLGDRIGFQPELEQVARAVERGASLAGCRHDLDATPDPRPHITDAAAVLRIAQRSLEDLGAATVSVTAFAGKAAAAMDPDELAWSLDALARNLAATVGGDRNIQVTASIGSFTSEATTVGLSPGPCIVFDIECGSALEGAPSDESSGAAVPGIGIVAAHDAVGRAGGSIAFSRTGVGRAACTVYVPALSVAPVEVGGEQEPVGTAA
jgi:hypothetical protein